MPQSSDNKTPLRGEQLSELYPTPKTFEERRLEQDERDMRRLARLPKHPALSIGVRLYAACIGFLVATLPVSGLVKDQMIWLMAGVFTSFLLGLVGLGFMLWMILQIIATFQKLSRSPAVFFATYIGSMAPLGYVVYLLLGAGLALYAVLTVVHFVLVYVVVKLMLRQIVVR